MESPRARVLTRDECLRLLADGPSIGRLAINVAALPVIFPVHFALFEDSVLVPTVPETTLHAAIDSTVVAFHADHYEQPGPSGWSVLVQGMARRIRESDELHRARHVPLETWALGPEPPDLTLIEPALLSGRWYSSGATLPPS